MATFDTAGFVSVFTTITDRIKTELDEQFEQKRIIGSEYANSYTQLMDRALQLAFSTQATMADIDLKEEQKADFIAKRQPSVDLLEAQEEEVIASKDLKVQQKSDLAAKQQPSIDLINAQEEVYIRQKAGFDDNAKQKMFEAQLNSWGLMFSSGMIEQAPAIITNDAARTLYNNMGRSIMGDDFTDIPAT